MWNAIASLYWRCSSGCCRRGRWCWKWKWQRRARRVFCQSAAGRVVAAERHRPQGAGQHRRIPRRGGGAQFACAGRLDATGKLAGKRVNAIVCCNMIHIALWAACQGLIAGAGRVLQPGGILFLYGPFKIHGHHTARSNQEFDAWLRGQNPEWGIRDIGDVRALATEHGLTLAETVPMPANNLSVVFRRA